MSCFTKREWKVSPSQPKALYLSRNECDGGSATINNPTDTNDKRKKIKHGKNSHNRHLQNLSSDKWRNGQFLRLRRWPLPLPPLPFRPCPCEQSANGHSTMTKSTISFCPVFPEHRQEKVSNSRSFELLSTSFHIGGAPPMSGPTVTSTKGQEYGENTERIHEEEHTRKARNTGVWGNTGRTHEEGQEYGENTERTHEEGQEYGENMETYGENTRGENQTPYSFQLPSISVLLTAFKTFCSNKLMILTGTSWHLKQSMHSHWNHTETTLKSTCFIDLLESVEVITTCNHCNYHLCHCNCNFVVATEGSTPMSCNPSSTWPVRPWLQRWLLAEVVLPHHYRKDTFGYFFRTIWWVFVFLSMSQLFHCIL